jgi:hypothetical protein
LSRAEFSRSVLGELIEISLENIHGRLHVLPLIHLALQLQTGIPAVTLQHQPDQISGSFGPALLSPGCSH